MGIRIGLIGIGKIARDQHIPALMGDPRFELIATASRSGAGIAGVVAFTDIENMLAAGLDLDAVSLCTPPIGRDAVAARAIDSGMHVMLEKPPGATVGEVQGLADRAREKGVTLYATWHSREAGSVDAARAWLASRQVKSVSIVWREDVRQWHPGQEWIFDAGGFGVFDPGINALSIATRILPDPLIFEGARIAVPQGRASPIAATLSLRTGGAPVSVDFDFREEGKQIWDIVVETDAGTLQLRDGGSRLQLPGVDPVSGPEGEYPRLYEHFAELIGKGESDVDTAPLALALTALATADRVTTEPFTF